AVTRNAAARTALEFMRPTSASAMPLRIFRHFAHRSPLAAKRGWRAAKSAWRPRIADCRKIAMVWALQLGARMNERWEILRPVAESEMARVFLARDRKTGRRVALKVLDAMMDPARFERE